MGIDKNSLVMGILISSVLLTVLFTYFQNRGRARSAAEITDQPTKLRPQLKFAVALYFQ